MEQKDLRNLENKCIQESPPSCTATCPIHVDVKVFLTKIQEDKIDDAFKVLHKKQPFPGIIGRICDHPCQLTCKRQEVGDSINIADLEKYCIENNTYLPKKVLLSPQKNKRAAIVGGGLSGLTAAYDLAKKGYPTSIFEAKDRLGGSLWNISETVLPRQIINDELNIIEELGVEIHLNTKIGEDIALAELIRDFDVIYLGLGNASQASLIEKFNLQIDERGKIVIDPITFSTSIQGVFAGGSMVNDEDSFIKSVADGRRAAISIDRYLQIVSLTASRENEGSFSTRLFTNTSGILPSKAVKANNQNLGYTKEEAKEEASRCLQCECLECVKACHYLRSYGSYPKKYLREIYNNESIVMGNRKANKMINSCSDCGLCEVVCPNNLDMGEVCKKSREYMVKIEKMPPSAHDFALRDMAFNNSKKFAITCHQAGYESSKYLFFPGCQLSGSSPEHVEKVYSYLQEKVTEGVGLMLRCCSAPAEWSGQQEAFQAELSEIVADWENVGRPTLILACSSCYEIFKNYLPQVEIVSLWEIFEKYGLPNEEKNKGNLKVAVHDACTTRHESQIHESVRKIINQLGYQIEELVYNREKTQCCGFGGLMSFANRKMADNVVQERIAESDLDYVSYCAMCRDNFSAKGKPSLHLLDLILQEDREKAAMRKSPGFSQRHENRNRLKKRILRKLWGKEMETIDSGSQKTKLIISSEVLEILENRLILIEDIEKVIEFAERTGNKLVNKETGNLLAYKKAVSVTYWVEYAPQGDGYNVYNAYSHRMEISEEVKS